MTMELLTNCERCNIGFTQVNRRHHCRLCGKQICGTCSVHKALVPSDSIILMDRKGLLQKQMLNEDEEIEHLHENDYNRIIIQSKRAEDRYKLAHVPLRVCNVCYTNLEPIQEQLRATNSNAVRFNAIDPTSARRLFNSPIAFTLGHEIRKAAFTLNNLLPLPRRMGYLESTAFRSTMMEDDNNSCRQLSDACFGGQVQSNLANFDGIKIPAQLINMARGIAVLTVVKGGFGLGVEFGTGLVVARLKHDPTSWSAPCAIGLGGVSWGALAGAQVSDHVFLLMTDQAVDMLASEEGSVQLGADVGISVGPLGRNLEGNVGFSSSSSISPIYTYSLSKGLYAGISLDGKMLFCRHNVNEKFYGSEHINPRDLLSGKIATPPAAQPLYDALKRCHYYSVVRGGLVDRSASSTVTSSGIQNRFNHHLPPVMNDDITSSSNMTSSSTRFDSNNNNDDRHEEYGFI